MNLIIVGFENQGEELIKRKTDTNWIKLNTIAEAKNISEANAFFFLESEAVNYDFDFTNKPIFINAVVETLTEYNLPAHVLRFNGWPGWMEKDKWEIAGQLSIDALSVLGYLNIEPISFPDKPGFISPSVISLIINEAFYAEAAGVSNRESIDTAMKLGTGYPYGPFEWAEKIGVDKVYSLLDKLSKYDDRYLPAQSLKTEQNQK